MARHWHRAGNPNSIHGSGRATRAVLEDARERLAASVGADPAEVVFTSGGTEADNLAIRGAVGAGATRGRTAAAAATTEHVAVRDAVASSGPADARWVGVDATGVVLDEDLSALDEAVAVLSIGWVNAETGTVNDPVRTVQAARSVGALAHSDAVAALGHLGVDFAASGLDLMSLSAHKVGGPVGVGALIARRDASLVPTSFGGGQERRLRSGTVPALLAVGFAAAVEEAVRDLDGETDRLTRLGTSLREGLRALDGVRVHEAPVVSPAVVHATFDGCRADDLLMLLDAAGVECSTGSACSAGVHQPSHVLLAMGQSPEAAVGSLRFSFGPGSTTADVEAAVGALGDAVPRARAAAN